MAKKKINFEEMVCRVLPDIKKELKDLAYEDKKPFAKYTREILTKWVRFKIREKERKKKAHLEYMRNLRRKANVDA